MVLTRIGTLGQNTALQTDSLRQQDKLFEYQRQVSSGYVSQDYKGLAPDIMTLNSSKSLKTTKEGYQGNIQFIELRTERYRFAMDSMHTATDTLRTQVLHSMSAYDATDLMSSVQSNYSLVAQLVNTEENGQQIFSGSRTDVKPWNEDFIYPDSFKDSVGDFAATGETVTNITTTQTASASPVYTLTMTGSNVTDNDVGAITEINFGGTMVTAQIMSRTSATEITISYTDPELDDLNIAAGTAIDGGTIYDRVEDIVTANLKGNSNLKSLNIDDGVNLEYGIEAEPLISDAMKAIGRLVQYDNLSDFANSSPLSNSQRNFMQSQLDDFVTGITSISTEQTKNGLNQQILEDTDQRHQDELTYIEEVISGIEDVDLAEAISNLQLAELSLQASFSTLSRVNTTTLLNFI